MSNVRMVRVSELTESPTNPRQLFGDLEELAASIKAKGVMQPVLARPVAGGLELVFGHRRLRASKLAGLKEIPVIVRKMDDVEVLEAQIIENQARADVHPLELAGGYRRLMDRGFTGEQVADRLGISRSSVFTTLKLLDLAPDVRGTFLAGKLSTHAAVAIARLKGERLQVSATKAVVDASKDGPLPVRAVQRLLANRFAAKKSKPEERSPKSSVEDDSELAARANAVLFRRVVELVERRAALEDSDLRLMLVALNETNDNATAFLLERGVTERKVSGLKGAHLRGLLLEMVLTLWAKPGTPAESIVAKAFGLSMAEQRKTAQALTEAESLMGKRG